MITFNDFNNIVDDCSSINLAEANGKFVVYINGKLFKTNNDKVVFKDVKSAYKAVKQSTLWFNVKYMVYEKLYKEKHNDYCDICKMSYPSKENRMMMKITNEFFDKLVSQGKIRAKEITQEKDSDYYYSVCNI